MVEVKNLTKYYGNFLAIEDVSFEVKKGEIVGFLGPNGAGKTTTMRIITGFLPPSSGTAAVAGYDLVDKSQQARSHIGYLPETVPLYTDMTVEGYLSFMGTIRGMKSNGSRPVSTTLLTPAVWEITGGATLASFPKGSGSGWE